MLFIDARQTGEMVSRVHRELTDDDIATIARTYHAWRGEGAAGKYAHVPGFCQGASLEEVRQNSFVLTPGRYVGSTVAAEETQPFGARLQRLTEMMDAQLVESRRLEEVIRAGLGDLSSR